MVKRTIRMTILGALLFIVLILAAGTVLSLAAMSRLPAGPRAGLQSRNLEEAAEDLRATGLHGWELVRAATNLVDDRMQ